MFKNQLMPIEEGALSMNDKGMNATYYRALLKCFLSNLSSIFSIAA